MESAEGPVYYGNALKALMYITCMRRKLPIPTINQGPFSPLNVWKSKKKSPMVANTKLGYIRDGASDPMLASTQRAKKGMRNVFTMSLYIMSISMMIR